MFLKAMTPVNRTLLIEDKQKRRIEEVDKLPMQHEEQEKQEIDWEANENQNQSGNGKDIEEDEKRKILRDRNRQGIQRRN